VTADLSQIIVPQAEVPSGELTESMFAAALEDVVAGTAPADDKAPAVFFDATYPSGGLKALLNESLWRLGGGPPLSLRGVHGVAPHQRGYW
jgi:predicted AAA+ superfamily ATPase